MDVDPNGDYFGDYASYNEEEFGMPLDVVDEDDAEADLHESAMAELETGIEPERSSPTASGEPSATAPVNQDTSNPSHAPFRLRGGAEEGLRKEPFVVKFTEGEAGKVYAQNGKDGNARYREELHGARSNPYAPFASKRDWEIARWAKLRGPGSTAFSELINIKGVRHTCLSLNSQLTTSFTLIGH